MATKLVQTVVDIAFDTVEGATDLVGGLIDGISEQPIKTLSDTNFESGTSSVQILCEDEVQMKKIIGDVTYFLATNGGVVNFSKSAAR